MEVACGKMPQFSLRVTVLLPDGAEPANFSLSKWDTYGDILKKLGELGGRFKDLTLTSLRDFVTAGDCDNPFPLLLFQTKFC